MDLHNQSQRYACCVCGQRPSQDNSKMVFVRPCGHHAHLECANKRLETTHKECGLCTKVIEKLDPYPNTDCAVCGQEPGDRERMFLLRPCAHHGHYACLISHQLMQGNMCSRCGTPIVVMVPYPETSEAMKRGEFDPTGILLGKLP